MTAPRVDLSFDAYLKSQAGKELGKQTAPAPAQRQMPDLSYEAYLRQREPSTFERVSAGVLGAVDAPLRVLAQTGARLAGIGESEETKRKYQSVVDKAFERLGPKGKARETYETSAAVASLPLEIAKYAGVSMIPGLGLPLATAMGAGEAAGGLKEESSAALAKGLAERFGAPRVAGALAPVVESGVGRAAFDVVLGEALAAGAKAVPKAYRGAKALAKAPGQSAADAFAAGMREGAGEATEAAAPSFTQYLPFGATPAPMTGPMVSQPSPLVAAVEEGAKKVAGRKRQAKVKQPAAEPVPAPVITEPPAAPRVSRMTEEAPVPMPPRQVGRPEQQTIVDFSGEAQVPATYRVVDARSLIPSHNPFTFQQSQQYPKEIQGRSYHTDDKAQRVVEAESMNLRSEPLLDQTVMPQSGAPIVTPDGIVVAGNQRSMILRRAIEFAPERYQQYANNLRANAGKFGLTPEDFAGVEMPVLVREIDPQDTKTLATLNRISDVTETKAKSGLDDAAARVANLRSAGTPLKHLASTLQPEETVSDYLGRAEGKEFIKQLIDTGVIAQQEMPRYIDDVDAGTLNQEGKLLMQRMVLLSAIDDPEILSRAPTSIVQKLEGAAPHIVRSDFEGAPEFAIGSTIKQALELLTEAAARGIPLKQLAKQENLFAEVADPGVMQMAEFLGKATKTEITNRFRAYGAAAGDARVRAETGAVDMFGESIVTPEDARAALLSPPTPRAPKAKAVEEAIVPEAVAPPVVEAPVVAPEAARPAILGLTPAKRNKALLDIKNKTPTFEREKLLEQLSDDDLAEVAQYAQNHIKKLEKKYGKKNINEYAPEVQEDITRGLMLGHDAQYTLYNRAGDKKRALSAEGKPGKQPRSGVIAPQTMNAIAGAGLGATTGVAAEEDSELSPLQRALLYGAAGTAGGALVARRMMAGKPRAVPSIPELAPVAETINVGARQAAKEEPGLLKWAQRVRNQLVSETYVLEQAAKQFGNPAQAKVIGGRIAQQQGSRQAARGWLQDNLTPLIANLSDAEKESVRALMKARRDLQIRQQGGAAKSAVDMETLEAAVAAGNANPKIAQVADRITQMHRELLAKRYAAGLLSKEAYEAIKASDDYYTPFFREMADEAKATGALPGSRGGRFSIFSSGVRRMDRSAESLEQTADPLETIITDAARTYRDVSKQRVANVIFGIADEGNLPFIKRIQADPMNPPKGEGIIQQKRDGKLYTYEVTDKDLFNALAGMDRIANSALVKFANAVKDVKTAGITVLPDFAIANVIRDVAASGLQRPDAARAAREAAIGAGLGGGLGVATGDKDDSAVKRFLVGAGLGTGAGLYTRPLLETMSAMKAIVRNEQIFRDFLADGASTEGFYIKNANDAAKALKELEKTPRRLEEIVKSIVIPTNWLQTLRKIGSVAEQSTRLAAYRQMKEAGFSAGDAALAAQDRTLRFANIGASPTVKNLAAMTPFWNAKVQGWDKLGRLLLTKGNRGKTAALGAGMLTAPTIALWSVNKDNPEYWERPAWEKNLFWLVPKSFIGEEGEKGFYRIPKPFELGFLFASLPERLLDYATQAGLDVPFIGEIASESPVVAEPGRGLTRSALDMATATMEGTLPIPEVANVPLQVMVNRDLFRDRPIVTKPQFSPELQVTEESSTIARALARAGVSPEMTDFVIRSTLGTAGSELSKAVDIGARAVGLNAPPPPAGATRIPVLGRFAERFTTSTKGQTDPEAMARERLRELNQVRTDLNELRRIGDRGRLLDFVDKNLENVKLLEKIQPLETELEKISRLRTQVRKAPGLTPDQRQGALEILRERGQKISETLIGVPSR